ncbi:MAG: murein biosynthesis integral membrane protein MurJ [Sedimentisphaeraceae bacterium JB056]
MVKGFKQIASFTMLSRILGLIRDICYSKYFGATALGDAWLIAFRIPNLSRRIFGEGAASASFIPVYSEMLEKDRKTADMLANTTVTIMFTFLSFLVVVGWAIMWIYRFAANPTPETVTIISLASVMLPYAAVICTVAILAGILNVHSHFAAPAAAPVVLNIFIIGAIVITGSLLGLPTTAQVYTAAVCVLIAGIVQTVMQLIPLKKKGVKLMPCWQVNSGAFRKVIWLMGPMILGTTATQINTFADDIIAWFFSGSEAKGAELVIMGKTMAYPLWRGCVMQLYLAQRLYQLPLGVIGIALATAIFPVLSRSAARNDNEEFISTLTKGIKCAFYLAIPCGVGLCLVAKPLISVLFEGDKFTASDITSTSIILYCYAFGLAGFFIQQIITRAFYATNDSKMPARTAVIAVIVNVLLNLTLIWFMGAAGLGLATAICSYIQIIILLAVLKNRYREQFTQGFATAITKVIIASVIMFIAGRTLMIAMAALPADLKFNCIRIAAQIIICASVYLALSKIMKIEMLEIITNKKAAS